MAFVSVRESSGIHQIEEIWGAGITSKEAIEGLKSGGELAEADNELVEHESAEAQNLEQEQQRDDNGVLQSEMCSGFSESHVFSFDRYPELYLRSK